MCWWWVGMVWRGSWKGLRQGNLREGIERGRCHHLLLLGRLRWWWKGARDCRHPLTKVLPITMWSVLKVLSPHLTWWQTSAPLYYSCFPRLTPRDLSITSTQVSPMYEHLAQVSVVRKVGLAGNLARPLTHCYQVRRLRQSCAEGRVLRIGIRGCSHISQPGEGREWWGGMGARMGIILTWFLLEGRSLLGLHTCKWDTPATKALIGEHLLFYQPHLSK